MKSWYERNKMDNNVIDKPVALVLGGTFPHRELISNLQQRGYHTVLVDYLEHSPAKEIADEHIRESTLDQETVLEIAQDRNASLVISACIDQANVTACFVGAKMGLPVPYSYETALSVTNKVLMKKKMVEHGIPTSKHIVVSDLSGFNSAEMRYPLIVKPSDSNSSKGVRKACDYDELSKYLEDALDISRNNQAIIEEYRVGREIGVDCFIKDKKATVIMTRERRKISSAGDTTQQIQGSLWPAELSEVDQSNLKEIAQRIAIAFELDNTPLMMQTIVSDNEASVIEFAARIGGGENYRIIKLHTDFDIINSAVDSFLGEPTILDHQLPTGLFADVYIYTHPGQFGEISGYEELLRNRTIEYFNVYKAHGATIGQELSSNNRVGAFLVGADDKNDVLAKIDTALASIEVHDIHGNPMMRKDIYIPDETIKAGRLV